MCLFGEQSAKIATHTQTHTHTHTHTRYFFCSSQLVNLILTNPTDETNPQNQRIKLIVIEQSNNPT